VALASAQQPIGRKVKEDEDPVMTSIHRGLDYATTHLNIVLGAAGGVIVVVLIAVLWSRDHAARDAAAASSISEVVLGFASGNYQSTLDAANAVQTSHPGTDAAQNAKYFAGACQLRMGQFPEAEQTLRAYLADTGTKGFYEHAARAALAASLEGQKKFADAAALYQEEANTLPEALANDSRLDAARALQRAGSVDQAKEILQKLSELTNSPVARQAKIELAVIESAHP
jgi:tetratricopeptide (TPR) repeat protein